MTGWLDTHEKLATWLEACGSILAIVAAFVIARIDGARAKAELHDVRRREEAAVIDRFAALALALETVVFSASTHVGGAADRIAGSHPAAAERMLKSSARELETIERQMIALPIQDLGIAEAAINYSCAMSQLILAHTQIDLLVDAYGEKGEMGDLPADTEALLREIEKSLRADAVTIAGITHKSQKMGLAKGLSISVP